MWDFTHDPAGFVDGGISTQDHFHPSFAGQQKLAAATATACPTATPLIVDATRR